MFNLEGIMPPMVTPFTENEKIDEEALIRETQFLVEAGVQGLTVCGSTGEGYSMTSEEISSVTALVKDEVGSNLPVITGVIADSANIAIAHGIAARKAGADALMVTPVHYVFKPTDEGNFEYYQRICEVVGLPVMIYNVIPWNAISVDLAVELSRIKQIIGIKQSGGDMHGLADMIIALGDRISIMSAIDDMLFPSFLVGANGAIACICTIAPKLCVDLWEASESNDIRKCIKIHKRLLTLWRVIGKGDMPARAKEALEQIGRHVGPGRGPMIQVSENTKAEIHNALLDTKLIL